MKIGIIAPKPPWFNEGQPKVLREQLLRFKKKNKIEVYCCDPYKGNKKVVKWNKIKINVYKGFTNSYLFSNKLYKDIKNQEFDIIHSHGFTTFMPLVAAILKKNTKKLIFQPHYHSEGSTILFKAFRKIYDPIIGNYILNKADKIICVSEYEKNLLIKKNKKIKDKIRVIPNGVDIERFERAKPLKFQGKLILYVGRLEKYKNIHKIIKTMKFLSEDFYLNIIGNGPYKEELGKLINKLNLNNQVNILSGLSNTEVAREYKTCSIFITLSDIEAFGITVLEALASGKPVITNDTTALSEFVEKFKGAVKGVKVNKISAQHLAEIIKKQEGKKIKVNLEDYNWDKIAKRLEECYKR
ncbi:MAG: glycosyltransferase family 4 protein [archaeon]